MKKLSFFLAFLLFAGLIFQFSSTNQASTHPKPTDTIVLQNEEDSDGQLRRREWIESMHRSAPGYNWRAAEYQTQRNRAKSRPGNVDLTRAAGTPDTIADGALIGTWREKGSSNQAGSVFDTQYDPVTDEIWLLSAGGTLWRGLRDGSQWSVVNQNYQFSDGMLKFIPTDTGRRLIAGIGHVPHYSDDEGMTWTAASGVQINDGWGRVKQPVFLANGTIYLLAKPGYWDSWRIYRSDDAGETYVQTNLYTDNDDGQSRIALCQPHHSQTAYFLRRVGGNARLIQISSDGASVEILSDTPLPGLSGEPNLIGTVTATDTVFYTFNNSDEVYRTTDFGQNWTLQGQIPSTPWGVGMFVSPHNSDVLFTGNINAYRSLDAGQNWELVNEWYEYYEDPVHQLHADMMTFSAYSTADGQDFTLSSNHGGLNITYDDFATNTNISTDGLNVGQFYSVKSSENDPLLLIGGSQDQGLQRGFDDLSDSPLPFDQVISGDYGHVEFTNEDNSFWTVYPGGWITYYHNAYAGGYTSNADMGSSTSSVWMPPIQNTRRSGENAVYFAGGDLTGNGGAHLIKLRRIPNGNIETTQSDFDFTSEAGADVSAIEVSPLNPDRVYTATTNGRFFYSDDGGETFAQNVNFLTEGHYLYGQSIYASQTDENTVYLAGSGYSNPPVYRSLDGGNFFADFSEGLPATLIFEITANADESLLFAATEAGPYVYIKAEGRWFDLSGRCAPVQTWWSVQYLEEINTVRFGTYGRGVWDFSVDFISEPTAVAKPAVMKNLQVSPNPAKNYIRVESSVDLKDLTLTDLTGKIVKTFSVNSRNPILDVKNLPAGLYMLSGRHENILFGTKIILIN